MAAADFDPLTAALVVVGLIVAEAITFRRVRAGTRTYAPATAKQKAVTSVLFVGMMAAWAIELSGWLPFGEHTKLVVGVFWLVAILYIMRLLAILERP